MKKAGWTFEKTLRGLFIATMENLMEPTSREALNKQTMQYNILELQALPQDMNYKLVRMEKNTDREKQVKGSCSILTFQNLQNSLIQELMLQNYCRRLQ